MASVETKFSVNLTEWDYKMAKINQDIAETSKNARKHGGGSNEVTKGIKDAFDPLSRGSLAKAGIMGAGIYGVVSAVKGLAQEIEALSKLDYLSSDQSAQLGVMAGFIEDFKRNYNEQAASVITSVANRISGGALATEGEDTARIAKNTKTLQLSQELEKAKEDRHTAGMSDDEKLAAMIEKRNKDELAASKLTGDARLNALIEIEKKGIEIDKARKESQEREVEREKDIADLYRKYNEAQKEAASQSLTDAQKLFNLVQDRLKLEDSIAKETDPKKQLELGVERAKIDGQIVKAQTELGRDGSDMAKKEADATRQRQENIKNLKNEIEGKRIDMLPDEAKISALRSKLTDLAAAMKSPGLDEEGRLKLQSEGLDVQKEINGLTDKKIKTAATPGSVTAAINTIFGRSANELILDESKQQTKLLARIDTSLTKMAEGSGMTGDMFDQFSFP